jgi:hypothetical protein
MAPESPLVAPMPTDPLLHFPSLAALTALILACDPTALTTSPRPRAALQGRPQRALSRGSRMKYKRCCEPTNAELGGSVAGFRAQLRHLGRAARSLAHALAPASSVKRPPRL